MWGVRTGGSSSAPQATHLDMVLTSGGLVLCQNCSESAPSSFCPLPLTAAGRWIGLHCYAMDSNALDTSPLHRCSFQWIGMDTIGMDTYPLIAGGTGAAAGVIVRGNPCARQVGRRATRRLRRTCGPPGQASDAINARLRTDVRRAIIGVIAHPSPAEIAPQSRRRRLAHDHRRRSADRPP